MESVGIRSVPWKEIEDDVSLARCCGVPKIRYSILEGLTNSLLSVSQLWTESRVEESKVREKSDSEIIGGCYRHPNTSVPEFIDALSVTLHKLKHMN